MLVWTENEEMNAITERHRLDILQRSAFETATRSMEVIRAIEQRVDTLVWIAERTKADVRFVHAEIDRIGSVEPTAAIDQEDALSDMIQQCQDHIKAAHDLFLTRRDKDTKNKNIHDEDGLLHAYTDVMEALADMHDALGELRWGIMTHDAALSPATSEATDDVDAMFAGILGEARRQ